LTVENGMGQPSLFFDYLLLLAPQFPDKNGSQDEHDHIKGA